MALLEAMGWHHQVEQHDRPAACGPGVIYYDSWYSPDGEYVSASFELVKEDFPLEPNLIAEALKIVVNNDSKFSRYVSALGLLSNMPLYELFRLSSFARARLQLKNYIQLTPVQHARAILKAIYV